MKRYSFGIFLSILMALTAWAQGADASFDMAKSQKELEIMRGIFKTTLSFNSDDTQKSDFFNFADIRFMYLQGQGANFFMQIMYFIPPVEIPMPFDDSFQSSLKMMEEDLKRAEKSLEELYSSSKSKSLVEDQIEDMKKEKESVAAERAKLQEQHKEIARQIQAQNESMKKQQEERRRKLLEIKEPLIEAIANYGDSLTVVKPDEYINLVFDTSGQYDIVSIQKSWIKDYKAGILTLDQFKAKVIQYSMKGR